MNKFKEAHDLVQQGFVSVNSSTRIGAIRLKETILETLLVVDKLMEEPSEAMRKAGLHAYMNNRTSPFQDASVIFDPVFKAMRDQMLKEIEE